MSSFYRKTDRGLLFKVRARPGIKQKRRPKIVDIGEGKIALEITVSDRATDGKANKAIVKALAEWLGVKRSTVSIKSGKLSRLKVVEVVGDVSLLAPLVSEQLTL